MRDTMKKNIISQKRVKYICPCCKEIDTILFCCECLRKQKEKTKKQARAEMKEKIRLLILHKHNWNTQELLEQLEKEGK